MMKGKVKWFDNKKGYGFIVSEDGKETFVHFSAIIKEGFKGLTDGLWVEYEVVEGSQGEQAANVRIIERPTE
ncbi:MAG: cold-shock protein [Alistipes sp.]|nr:cold-shock protein [Alistipes sp.]